MAEDELDLTSLGDDELVAQMHDDLYDGLKEEIEDGVRILLERGWAPYDVLTKALVEGMRIVGIDFRDGILFVPEVLMSANAMKAGMAILRPLLAATGAPKMGKMVIGTVKGDIHDIGKNLVCMMMEGAGFEVFDIGINNGVEKYLEAIEKHQPEILGMSALLTTTMPYMKVVIDTLKEKGIRNDYIVLVGGAPLNESFAEAVGADAYCRDAAVAVETAKALLARRQGSAAVAGRLSAASVRRRDRMSPERATTDETEVEAFWPRRVASGAPSARHRLRRAGARDPYAARRSARRLRRDLPAGFAAQPAGAHRRGGARQDPREPRAL